jgi:glycosyltransferase involved in cell wall biosynthesis
MKTDAPRLSVVIPCLNADKTLGVQLAALAGQEGSRPWEVIVADNGSTDGSPAVAESFQRQLPCLRLVDASGRRGQAHARNAGARVARGDALLFCDADDEVAPGWLAAMDEALAEQDFVASRYDTEKLNPDWVRRIHANPQKDGLNEYTYPRYLPHAGGGGLGIRRALHLEIGGFDESLPALEDTDYCWRLQLAGVSLEFVPGAVVHVRYRSTLSGIFRQGLAFGRYNVLIYKLYRARGMPRLGCLPGLRKWAVQILKTPQLLTRVGRGRWIWQLGWRLGRLDGCRRYRVLAP